MLPSECQSGVHLKFQKRIVKQQLCQITVELKIKQQKSLHIFLRKTIFFCTYPIPEISRAYLPQPNNGGNVRMKQYAHIKVMIFSAPLKDFNSQSMPKRGKNDAVRRTESTAIVITETKPRGKLLVINFKELT